MPEKTAAPRRRPIRTLRTIAGFALVGALAGACAPTGQGPLHFGLDGPSVGAFLGVAIAMIGKVAQFF